MVSEAQKAASAKYDANNTRQIVFKFNIGTDKDILDRLDSVQNRQGYVKELIRKDIKNMNREAIIKNAQGVIAVNEKASKEGKDFSMASIMDAERVIQIASTVPDQLTEEEKKRLSDKYRQPNPDWQDCKDIKDKFSLSWNELKMIAGAIYK